jgi:hypothetical protein
MVRCNCQKTKNQRSLACPGTASMLHILPHFENLQRKRVLVVDCNPSNIPVYLKQGNIEEFYVRAGASSASLSPSQMTDYIKQRFG